MRRFRITINVEYADERSVGDMAEALRQSVLEHIVSDLAMLDLLSTGLTQHASHSVHVVERLPAAERPGGTIDD